MGGPTRHQALPALPISLDAAPLPTEAHLNPRTKGLLPERSPAGPGYCASKRGRKDLQPTGQGGTAPRGS